MVKKVLLFKLSSNSSFDTALVSIHAMPVKSFIKGTYAIYNIKYWGFIMHAVNKI